MSDDEKKTSASFPVSIWYAAETGEILVARPTEKSFVTSISANPEAENGHPQLYSKLANALREAGAICPGPVLKSAK
jgi:hypothetical protein